MESNIATVTNRNGLSSNVQTENKKELKARNFIYNDTISVISVRNVSDNNGITENSGVEDDETTLKRLGKILVFSFSTVVLSVSSVVPWTTFKERIPSFISRTGRRC